MSESTAYETIKWIEETLIKHSDFALPGRKALLKSDREFDVILIDANQTPIERPKKKQKHYYSGKKKRHTLKTQIVVDKKTKGIICTAFFNGKRHDFKLFKESKTRIHPEIKTVTDTGYQGMQKLHRKSGLPTKERQEKSNHERRQKEKSRTFD